MREPRFDLTVSSRIARRRFSRPRNSGWIYMRLRCVPASKLSTSRRIVENALALPH